MQTPHLGSTCTTGLSAMKGVCYCLPFLVWTMLMDLLVFLFREKVFEMEGLSPW